VTTLLQRRLPGVRFDVPTPAPDEALPRMDIAFFAGFTANGPVDVPVAVESLAEFEDVFGGEITLLARDDGSPVRGLLHPALRQFFSHGGRRAWVQRVAAAHARTSWFPLQQMLLLRRPAPSAPWRVEPAWVLARSPGSWADAMSVRARCEAQPLALRPAAGPFDGSNLALTAHGPLALALGVGDTLRLPLSSTDQLQGRVAQVDSVGQNAIDGRLQRSLRLDRLAGLQQDTRGATPVRIGWTEPVPRGDGTVEHRAHVTGHWTVDAGTQQHRLTLQGRIPARAKLDAGEVLRVSFAGGRSPAWMAIDEIQATALGNTAGQIDVQLSGRPQVVPVSVRPAAIEAWRARAGETTAQWLRGGVGAAFPDGPEARQDGLALVPRADGAPSLFGLPDDQRHFTGRAQASTAARAEAAFELAPRDVRPLTGPRYPLASMPMPQDASGADGADDAKGEAMLLPLDTGPGLPRGLGARQLPLAALRRDGLDAFSWRLFAEPALAAFPADALADQAEALRLLGPSPRPLRGLHAVFGTAVDGPVEEPTLLAIPDAVQPGWQRKRRPTQPRTRHPDPPLPPALPNDGFDDCTITPLAAPQFEDDAPPDSAGNFLLRWTRPEAGVAFELQEAADQAFSVIAPVYSGTDTRLSVTGKPRGTLFYRVRALAGPRISAWSRVLEIQIGGSDFELRPWTDADLLALHRLLLRAAAGRGDMLALLGLPQHYRWPDALAHAEALRGGPQPTEADAPPALGEDETRALSHGTLNHPWLLTRRVDDFIAAPPDGAIAGQLAASALRRGAWIAVANQPLKDVVALGLAASTEERQALLEAQVNPVWASPAGFVAGSSETLCLDADWRPVNVRRLMSLLRRAALQRGAHYVFEPNGAALRRTVERAFEALLDQLLRRGAFAGRSAAQAFRVEVGDEINTPARGEAGQFRVDLKVAPALPLSFITVRLSRSGERLAAQELR
jgi:hypothetical protein